MLRLRLDTPLVCRCPGNLQNDVSSPRLAIPYRPPMDNCFEQSVFNWQLRHGHYDMAQHYVQSTDPSTHNLLTLAIAFRDEHSVLQFPGARQLLDIFLDKLVRYESPPIVTLFLVRAYYPLSPRLHQFMVCKALEVNAITWMFSNVTWLYTVLDMMAGTSLYLLFCRLPEDADSTKRGRAEYLTWCVEAGLTTFDPHGKQPPESPYLPYSSRCPFSLCVKHNLLHEAVLMYEAGAVSYKELSFHRVNVNQSARPLTAMNTFLSVVCNQPKTLLNMCLSKVSEAAGCGRWREGRVRQLGLPEQVVSQILFQGPIRHYMNAINDQLFRQTQNDNGSSSTS